ncbi:MAG: WG repeat-containing protein [Thermotaleaceae bacterium]
MKKYAKIFILFSLAIFLTACGNRSEKAVSTDEEENASLYPAYVYEENYKKWGYINNQGQFVIKPQFNSGEDFDSQGLAVIQKGESYGIINTKGDYVLEPVYHYIQATDEGIIIAVKDENGSYILMNREGGIIGQGKGYIDKYSEGVALFSESVDWENRRYGYRDREGNVVIEPQYIWGSAFKNGKALVKIEEKSFAVIDLKGNVISTLDEDIVGEISEDIVIYRDEATSKEGYMTIDGKKITEAEFLQAKPFKNGYGEVMISDTQDNYLWTLIDKKGAFVIEPKYGSVQDLGAGLYAVSNPVKDMGWMWMWLDYSPKAIIDKEGKLLSDFIYYQIDKVEEGMHYLSDGVYTYITDDQYKPLDKFPKLYGIGQIKEFNGLLKVELDNELLYLTKEGKEIWRSEYSYSLKNGGRIRAKKYRPDRFSLTYYPQIENHPDKGIESQLNEDLKKIFIKEERTTDPEEIYYEIVDRDFEIKELGEVVTIVENGYFFPIGAAHGTPWFSGHHMNIRTGKFYSMEDLFISDSNYMKRLESIVKKQIEMQQDDEDAMYFEGAEPTISAGQYFLLTEKGMKIYYQVYEIAPYAAGTPSFEIPYEEIKDILDKEGALWRAIEAQVELY